MGNGTKGNQGGKKKQKEQKVPAAKPSTPMPTPIQIRSRMRLSKNEIMLLIIGTALALPGIGSGDPLVAIPCLLISWGAFMYIFVKHEGSRLVRGLLAALITVVLVAVGVRASGTKIVIDALTPISHPYSLPGMSLHMKIRINHLAGNRRKYLFDFGNKNNERLSIYISPDSIFTLAFLDAKGEQHSVQIPLGGDGIPLSKYFYLGCNFGIDGQSTQLWVLVDGKERGSLRLPFRVDIESLDVPGGVVGADLDGNNGGSFDLKEFAAYSRTLDDKEIKSTSDHFQGNPIRVYTEFRGKQWMRVNRIGNHDAHQFDPAAAPIFRKDKD